MGHIHTLVSTREWIAMLHDVMLMGITRKPPYNKTLKGQSQNVGIIFDLVSVETPFETTQ